MASFFLHLNRSHSPDMKKVPQLPSADPRALLEYMYGFISDNKKNKFESIIHERTRYITVVLEDIFQPHNASAVLRTCDVFGIQDIHIIENRNRYEVNPDVALGSSKWLTLVKYNRAEDNTRDCLEKLKSKGYRIIATSPHRNDFTPINIPLDRKIALVFGTELEGLTETAMQMADDFVRIPMYGFTESLNISVSAAILISTLMERLRKSGIDWQLTEAEKTGVQLAWVRQVIKKPDLIEKAFSRGRTG